MDDDEDFFSDDDLDAIPINTLARLEQQAVLSSTQRPNSNSNSNPTPSQRLRSAVTAPPPLRRVIAHNAASLNRAGSASNRNLPWRPPQSTRTPPIQPQLPPDAPPPSAPAPPSSDYGFDDEDVVDLDEPSMVIQSAAKAPPARAVPNASRYGAKQLLDPETEAAYAAADAELDSQTFGRWQRPSTQQQNGSLDVSGLQARIAELEAEQSRLRQAEHEAREEARAKQGEISIVRSNHEKSSKLYEARISVMQRLHADETAKHKAELESQRKEREKMETNNRFLQHDLAQEAERSKRHNGVSRSSRAGPSTQMATPQKSKRVTRGDGFNDTEIHIVSPSKSKDRAKDVTPKVGAKRKRPVNDSPAPELSFTRPPHAVRHESSEQTTASVEPPIINQIVEDDKKYQYLQLVMNHRPYEGHERSLEVLARHAFPSKPEKTMASLFLDKVARVRASKDENLPVALAHIMLDFWSRCLQERYFAPLYLVLGLLRLAWQSEPPSSKSKSLVQAVSLCTASIDLVARNIVRASTNRNFAASIDRDGFEKLSNELVVDDILDLLLELCQAATLSLEHTEVFWKTVDMHFVLVMLNKAQPLNQILTMLQILGTSAKATSFGVVVEDPEAQLQHEKGMVDHLTNMLFETPQAPKDEPAYTDQEILELRIEVLKVLKAMCMSDHGTLLLTQHRTAIGRLIRFLDAQVTRLHRVRPSLGMPKASPEGVVHDMIAETVNRSTRLVHHVFRAVQDPSTIIQRINAIHGGYHRFLISLTRVAFSDQLAFEHGIEDQASEAAHNVLDEVLGPEDGEAVMKAVETPRGTGGSTTERNTTSEERRASTQLYDDTTMSDEPS